MRILILQLAWLILAIPLSASADTLHLKNGNAISGIIKSEDRESVELEIDIGTVKFKKDELENIERSTTAHDAGILRQEWQEKKQAERKEREEQISIRIQDGPRDDRAQSSVKEEKVRVDDETGHIITRVVINGLVPVNLIVDTGATLVVLSKKAGERLAEAGVKPKPNKIKQVDLTLGDGRKVKAEFVVLDTVRIEDSVAEKVEAAIMPEDQIKSGYDGVLGMSFLNRFNFGFKQKEGKLTLEKLK
jgi:clan AA aspartic protease (TIGR02281 family)